MKPAINYPAPTDRAPADLQAPAAGPHVAAVVVSFHPDLAKLGRLLAALAPQCQQIIVVDNGSAAAVTDWLQQHPCPVPYRVLLLGSNQGIAAAQNHGLRCALQSGANYVILFDHDSCPAPGMVAELLAVAQAQQAAGHLVAGVGPRYLDARQNNPPPFVQRVGWRIARHSCSGPETAVPVDYLIASGCLIPATALRAVGLMEEPLFIDYVDIEWGLRAQSHGYSCFGACRAQMEHDLGDAPIWIMGHPFPIRSPLRHYYMFRNAVWLYRQPWIALRWRLLDGWRLLLKYGFYTLFARPRRAHCLHMSKGVLHGLRGRMGQAP